MILPNSELFGKITATISPCGLLTDPLLNLHFFLFFVTYHYQTYKIEKIYHKKGQKSNDAFEKRI